MEPPEICKASAYQNPKSKGSQCDWKQPQWRNEYNGGREYKPSYNLAPTDISPVLISAAHFDYDTSTIDHDDFGFDEDEDFEKQENRLKEGNSFDQNDYSDGDQMLVPMVWGMIPFWHDSSSDPRKHGLSTNNCRLESMLESKLYRNAFHKGQRCVVLCEGFYEWQTTNPKATKPSERAAYYIYMPQQNNVSIADKESWHHCVDKLNLLKMAGLFDIWTNANGEQMYSYSVITFESDDKLNWLHHRSPAILDSDEAVADWLDYKRVTDTPYLLSLLKPTNSLEWHPVSNLVNNARVKSDQCNKRMDETKKVNTPGSKFMQSWLGLGKHKASQEDHKDGGPSGSQSVNDQLNSSADEKKSK